MGVELGKVLAKNILAQLDKPADVTGHDSSVSFLDSLIYFILLLIDVYVHRLLGLFITINDTEKSNKYRFKLISPPLPSLILFIFWTGLYDKVAMHESGRKKL